MFNRFDGMCIATILVVPLSIQNIIVYPFLFLYFAKISHVDCIQKNSKKILYWERCSGILASMFAELTSNRISAGEV
jgi:hypothetical protein